MNRTLSHLSKTQQEFIDLVIIQCKPYAEAAELLNVTYSAIQDFYKDLGSSWRPIVKVRNKWKSKEIGGNFWDFCHWYLTAEPKCHYCGVTQKELDNLHLLGIVNKKPTRGRTLEIDRKVSSEEYNNIPNLVLSCYWCNNAKTDTFTEEEFKIIGQAISTVWKSRLAIKRYGFH
jgi:5-methylcytosine-specific restriction endonuclease McrA